MGRWQWMVAWFWAGMVAAAPLAHPQSAQAAISIRSPPGGWERPDDEATERAQAWADAVGGRVVQAYSTESDDDFSETLAVIELDGPLPEGGDADPAAVLFASAGPAIAQARAPDDATIDFDDEGNPGTLSGRWSDDERGETYYVAMASGGPTHAIVVMAVRTDEASLYARGFETVAAELEGIAPPLATFDQTRWRAWGLIGWVIFGVVAWGVLWRIGDGRDTATELGRKVAGVCTIAAFIVLGVAWLALGNSGSELALAGLSREWAVAELFLIGVGVAVVCLLIGAIRSAQVRPIQSAPNDGAFGRLRVQAARSVPQRQSMVAARHDGPSTLTPAEETPADETPADETPADETPADETPADETPADETPADETPATEVTDDDRTVLSLVPVPPAGAEPGAPDQAQRGDNTLVGAYPPPTKPGPPPER